MPRTTSRPSSSRILSSRDVLLGRGSAVTQHPGNEAYRLLVDLHRHQYQNAPRFRKVSIASQVVDGIREKGGQFVERINADDDALLDEDSIILYQATPYNKALEKTCQALRENNISKKRESILRKALYKMKKSPARAAPPKVLDQGDVKSSSKTPAAKPKPQPTKRSCATPRKQQHRSRATTKRTRGTRSSSALRTKKSGPTKMEPIDDSKSSGPARVPVSDDEASTCSNSSEYRPGPQSTPSSLARPSTRFSLVTPAARLIPSSATKMLPSSLTREPSLVTPGLDQLPDVAAAAAAASLEKATSIVQGASTLFDTIKEGTEDHPDPVITAAKNSGDEEEVRSLDDVSCLSCCYGEQACSWDAPAIIGYEILASVPTSPLFLRTSSSFSHTPPRRVSDVTVHCMETAARIHDPWDCMELFGKDTFG